MEWKKQSLLKKVFDKIFEVFLIFFFFLEREFRFCRPGGTAMARYLLSTSFRSLIQVILPPQILLPQPPCLFYTSDAADDGLGLVIYGCR
ncbi:hypothetical protein KW811_22985, partial [Enterobacter quasiroggenkampii]|uniref:hypothetical protein n=1 Tax=Enterobacter quasiroggenkampii TaxID=2497436 RepID=UPI0021CE17F0